MTRDLTASILDQMSDEMQIAVQVKAAESGFSDPVDYIIDLRDKLEGDLDFWKKVEAEGERPLAEQEKDFLKEYFGE